MKKKTTIKAICLIAICLISFNFTALSQDSKVNDQSKSMDYIVTLLGDSTAVEITAIEAETVAYKKVGSSIPYSESKEKLAYVVFANGEKLSFNELAGNSSNARSIVTTEEKKDIKELEYVGEIVARQHVLVSGKGKNAYDTVVLKAKEEAMALGGKVIYITKNKLVSIPTTMWVIKGEVYK